MIIYEVNIIIKNTEIKNEFLLWLHSHAKKMLTFDGFLKYDLFSSNTSKNEYLVHYHLKSIEFLDNYLNQNAKNMRKEGKDKFNNQLSIKRRILTELDI